MKKLALSKTRLGFVGFSLLAWALLSFPSSSSVEQWAKTYGGDSADEAHSIQQTSDGGYIVAGQTASFGAGNFDLWVLKLDAKGNIQWQKTYDIAEKDLAYIQQTKDGGYIAAGLTGYSGMRFDEFSLWVLKLDAKGNVQWQKTYDVGRSSEAKSIQQTQDGGYIVAGSAEISNNSNAWILKLDANGNVQWQKTYGGRKGDGAESVQQTRDGGYIVAGWTASFGAGDFDVWVLKLDANGNVQWQKTYGGRGWDSADSIQQTQDGGYIVAGYTKSFGAGDFDIWVLKLDANGNVQWQKTYGGRGWDSAHSIQQTQDGGYIVAGYTLSFGAGSWDAWILKLDANGNVQWQKTYGGSDQDFAYSVQQTKDGGYIVAGYTLSFGAGGSDAWILKLDANGNIAGCPIVKNSNAKVNNTRAVEAKSNASVKNTSARASNTEAVVKTTTANITQICPKR